MDDGIQFEDNRANVKESLSEAIVAYLFEAGMELSSQTARNQRIDTGQTKGAWTYIVDEDAKEVVIGNPLENAIWEEFGTGEYALNGDGRKTPWVYTDRQGETHFTHGKKPIRPLWNAFESVKSKLIKRAEVVFKNRMG